MGEMGIVDLARTAAFNGARLCSRQLVVESTGLNAASPGSGSLIASAY